MNTSKTAQLCQELKSLERIALCLNSSVCSNVLAAIVSKVLKPSDILAVTVETPFSPQGACVRAISIAKALGLKHKIVRISFSQLPKDIVTERQFRHLRYKSFIYDQMKKAANEEGFTKLIDATSVKTSDQNMLDWDECRQARKLYGIISPLREADYTLDEIRRLGRAYGLYEAFCRSSVDACLLTRFSSSIPVTEQDLEQIKQIEASYKAMGYPNCRLKMVAYKTLQLEVPRRDFNSLSQLNPPFQLKAVDD